MIPESPNFSIEQNASMANLSTYRIGGKVAYLAHVTAGDSAAIKTLISWAQNESLPWAVIGNGSNILMPDGDLRALLIKFRTGPITISDNRLILSSGTSNSELALFAADHGLTGFGFLYDIPGTVGGAVMQNAGMNDDDFSQLVVSVTYVSPSGELFTSDKKDLDFGYRHSAFKDRLKDHLIVSAVLQPKGTDNPQKLHDEMEAVKKIRWSKFPMEFGNCGSVFKRPTGYFAGKLIQDAGLSGYTIGQAQVSPKHRNFLVNLGQATAKDVKDLIQYVQKEVFAQSGVQLERELIFLEEILH